MVQLLRYLLKANKSSGHAHFRKKFLDTLRLTVQGGHGGNGLPKYGGVGGQGGCVYFKAKEGITLWHVAQKYKEKRVHASSGTDSSKVRIVGKRGADECVQVPVGVQVIDEWGKKIADLNEPNAICIAAGGGMGGCTLTSFIGKPGQNHTISLDLKIIADVGLVGFPNAGKSTFLKAISNANPKIASYPFTTIRPQIGTITYKDLRSITIADLPGLIEGAHANFGKGYKFLKHIERTRLLLFMVDVTGFRLSAQHVQRNCLETVYALNKEVEVYDKCLLDKPCVLLINKMDLQNATDILKSIIPQLRNLNNGLEECPKELRPHKLIQFEEIIPISAQNLVRINYVKEQLRSILDSLASRDLATDKEEIKEILRRSLVELATKVA